MTFNRLSSPQFLSLLLILSGIYAYVSHLIHEKDMKRTEYISDSLVVEFRLVNVNLLRGIAGRRRPGFNSLSERYWIVSFFGDMVGCVLVEGGRVWRDDGGAFCTWEGT